MDPVIVSQKRTTAAIEVGEVIFGDSPSLPLLVGWYHPTSPAALERHLRDALRLHDDEELELRGHNGVHILVEDLARSGGDGGHGGAIQLSLRPRINNYMQRWERPFRRTPGASASGVSDAGSAATADRSSMATAAADMRRRKRRRWGGRKEISPSPTSSGGGVQPGDTAATHGSIQVRAAWSDEWHDYKWGVATPTRDMEMQLRRILDVPQYERQVILQDSETGELASVAQEDCTLRDGSRYLYAPTMDLSRYSRLMFEETFSTKTQMGILERLAALERMQSD